MSINKLLIFNVGTLWKHKDNYYFENSLYKFFEELSLYFEKLTVLVPVCKGKTSEHLQRLDTTRVSVLELPCYTSVGSSYKAMFRFFLNFHQHYKIHEYDCIILTEYLFPLFWYFYIKAKINKTSIIHYVRANAPVTTQKNNLFGFRKWIVRIISNMGNYSVLQLSKKTPAMVTGDELFKIFSANSAYVYKISPSSISAKDIIDKIEERSKEIGLKLLYVGRVERLKGIEILIDSIKILIQHRKLNIKLNIVGKDSRNGNYLENLKRKVREEKLNDYIEFHGHIPFGAELFRFYKKSHIFILPSYSEGRPKAIYEAMANGLGIIATNVGGIPDVINDKINGFLVSPGNVMEISDIIETLYINNELLKKIRKKALEEAIKYTREHSAQQMAKTIKIAVRESPH